MDYEKVIADFASGKLNKDEVFLAMDNDMCFLSYRGDEEDEDKIEAIEEKLMEYGTGGGEMDVIEICNAAGIPCEGC